MFICLGFSLISLVLSFRFKDVYEVQKSEQQKISLTLKEYGKDLKSSFKFILKSKRLKAYILFQVVFYSLICIFDTYNENLLIDLGVPEEQFSMIFAVLTFIGGISISLKKTIEKKFRNRTLSFISLIYIGAAIFVGVISSYSVDKLVIPMILIMYTIQKISTSIWYILEYKYLNNFTTEKERNKITFTYEFIGGISASIFSILGGLLLNILNVKNAVLMVGLVGTIAIVLVLDYMRSRFGLKPEEYRKEDIDLEYKEKVIK